MEEQRGITRRDIPWRAADVLTARRSHPLPRWVDVAVVLAVMAYLVAGASSAPRSSDEAAQVALSRDARLVFTDPRALAPGGATSAVLEAQRLVHGTVTRCAVAVGWYLGGARDADRPVLPGETAKAGDENRPHDVPAAFLGAARAGPAVIGAVGALMLYLLARRVAGRRVATAALVLFGLNSGFLLVARQATDTGAVVTFGLAAILLAAYASDRLERPAPVRLGAWTAVALAAGLCLAAGRGAAPFLLGVVAWCVVGLVRGVQAARRAALGGSTGPAPTGSNPLGEVGLLAVTALSALIVWVTVSPSLWGWLPERLITRGHDHAALVAAGALPDPGPGGLTGFGEAVRRLIDGPFASVPLPSSYAGSGWAGAPIGASRLAVGLALATVAVAGAVVLLRRRRVQRRTGWSEEELRRGTRPRDATPLLMWTVLVVVWTLTHPSRLPGDQLALLAPMAVLAAVGFVGAAEWVVRGVRRAAQARRAVREAQDDGGGDDARSPYRGQHRLVDMAEGAGASQAPGAGYAGPISDVTMAADRPTSGSPPPG